MSYPIENKPASNNGWFTPAQAKNYYGRYSRTGITCHWWNDPKLVKDSDHNNIVNLMLTRAKNGQAGVANYVLSNTKITRLVHPDNVPWASGSGNPVTVSIEFSPHLNTEGYKKGGWLIWQLEKIYNRKLALYPHNHWATTQCPGSISLSKLRSEANRWAVGTYNPIPPKPTPNRPKLVWSKLGKPQAYVCNKVTNLWNFNSVSWTMKSIKTFKKGTKLSIYGQVVNETLKTTYLLTEYSYTKRLTHGFNQADLDKFVVVVPAPNPTPPPTPEPPVTPAPEIPPEESEFEKRLNLLEKTLKYIVEFLAKVFSGFRPS